MTEQSKGVNGGKASTKPTQSELEKKRQEILERIRNQATIDVSENPPKPEVNNSAPVVVAKKYKNLKFLSPEEIPDRNHTFRIRRMVKHFGQEAVDNLKDSCADEKEFKWELYQAEEKGVVEHRPNTKPYNPEPNSGGASPIEVKWMNRTYYVDRQSDFKVEYCDKLIDYMRFGRSLRSFAAHINVTSETFNGWMRRYKILQDAADIAYGKGLEIIETLCFFVAAGMDATEMSKKFGVTRMNYKMLQFVAKSKFREDFFEKVNIDYGDAKKLAELEGPELDKKVQEIKERYNRITGPNPIADFKLYKGED